MLEYYDRIVESIAKKGAGVAEVVGHLCRVLSWFMLEFVEEDLSQGQYCQLYQASCHCF